MPTVQNAVRQDKYSVEKEAFGGLTYITMHGTLNEQFEGRKLASSVRTKKLVISMRDIRRFASWGMSEWTDFLNLTSDCDLYLVECSTYSVSQLNLVTGLMGHAKLVSFYASYRCGTCSEELQTLFVIPSNRMAIRDIPGSQQECPTCGGRARLEEYPAAFFDTIAAAPAFDIDDEALAFMRSHLNYDLSPDLTRFRAYRRVSKEYTYLRLTGNISTLPPEVVARASSGTTVIDLTDIVFDLPYLSAWRTFVQTAMPRVRSLQLLGCPPGFLEAAVRTEDLRDKLKVRTFAMFYQCGTCDMTSTQIVDVAQNLEELVTGVIPTVHCPSCRSSLVATLSPEHTAVLRALPARNRDVVLDSFLIKSRSEPADSLENCLVAIPTQEPTKVASRRTLYAVSAFAVVVLGALTMIAVKVWTSHPTVVSTTEPVIAPPAPEHPAFTRPDWIIADVPASAYCQDMINRLMCIGVSSYHAKRDDGVGDATDAALEELVNSVGLKVSEPFFRNTVIPMYSDVRAKALSTLQTAALDRANDAHTAAAYAAADEAVRSARKRVVESLRASGGAAVPVQRSDWYWEEYAATAGLGTEFVVFVRFDVSLDAVRTLVDKYSTTTSVMGSTATTAFPALGWRRPDFTNGAFLTKVGGSLATAGIAADSIVTAVGSQHVIDATSFAQRLEESSHGPGKVELTVQVGTAAATTVRLHDK